MSAKTTGAFNADALYVALDRRRREMRVSGSEVLRQAGINTPSTWTRLGQGRDVSVDTFLRLLGWLGESDVRPYSILAADPVTGSACAMHLREKAS